MGNLEHALSAYENALRHNPNSLPGLIQVAGIARIKEDYQKVGANPLGPTIPSRSFSWYLRNHHTPQAIDYFQRVVALQDDNGEVWSSLGLFSLSLHGTTAW